MKITTVRIVTAAGLASLLAGCAYPNGEPNYTGSGALMGGASGAAIGALADSRAPGAGALIGGAAGAIAGGLIGNSADQQARTQWRSAPPPTYYAPPPTYYAPPPETPPSVADIKALAKAGVSDDVITGKINQSRAVYNLDANAIIDLQNAGVSQRIISYMLNTTSTAAAQAPPPGTVVAAPSPEYVWVDGQWTWNGGTWVWVGAHWVLPPYPRALWVGAHWERGPYGWHWVGGHWR